jgi:hypothetical protein
MYNKTFRREKFPPDLEKKSENLTQKHRCTGHTSLPGIIARRQACFKYIFLNRVWNQWFSIDFSCLAPYYYKERGPNETVFVGFAWRVVT